MVSQGWGRYDTTSPGRMFWDLVPPPLLPSFFKVLFHTGDRLYMSALFTSVAVDKALEVIREKLEEDHADPQG